MRKIALGSLLGALGVLASCNSSAPGAIAWHKASFAEALTEAGKRDTLVMLDFYTDW